MDLLHDSSVEGLQKCANVRLLSISVVVLLAGAGVLAYSLGMVNSALSSLGLLIGGILVIVALYYICFHSTHWVYAPTGSEVKKVSLNCEAKRILKSWEEMREEFGFKSLNCKAEQSEIRLDCIYTKDKKYAALQLCQYSSFLYTPLTEIYYLTDDQAARFIERLSGLE